MMKKKDTLLLITKVKNEADIIESFIRYHCEIFDYIVVIDNGSVDGTYEILQSLISEGLPVCFVNEAYSEFDAFRFVNQYTKFYVEKFCADFVIFMDADEFLYCEGEINPRDYILALGRDKIHLCHWKTYIYKHDVNVFNFDDFSSYREESEETFTKVIIPGKLLVENGIVVSAGNHAAKCKDEILEELHQNIKFMHFPIRSMLQYKKQILVNSIHMLSNENYAMTTGNHWKKMFDATGSNVNLEELSLHYAYYEGDKRNIGIYNDDLNIRKKLKYTDKIINDIELILFRLMELQALQIKKLKLKKISLKIPIMLYGMGNYCVSMYNRINHNKYDIVAIADIDREKQFEIFENSIIISPGKMRFFKFDYIVVATDKFYKEAMNVIVDEVPFFKRENILKIDDFVIDEYRNQIEWY